MRAFRNAGTCSASPREVVIPVTPEGQNRKASPRALSPALARHRSARATRMGSREAKIRTGISRMGRPTTRAIRASGPHEWSVQLQHCSCSSDHCGLPRVQRRTQRQPIAARRLRRQCGENVILAPCRAAGAHHCERARPESSRGLDRAIEPVVTRASAPRPCSRGVEACCCHCPGGHQRDRLVREGPVSGSTAAWRGWPAAGCSAGEPSAPVGGRAHGGPHCIDPSRPRGVSKG